MFLYVTLYVLSAVDVCLHRYSGLGMFLYGTLWLRVYTHICNGLGRFLSGTLPARLFAFWTMDTQWTFNGHYNGHYNGHW